MPICQIYAVLLFAQDALKFVLALNFALLCRRLNFTGFGFWHETSLILWMLTLYLSLSLQYKDELKISARRSYKDSRFAAFAKSRRPCVNLVKFVSTDMDRIAGAAPQNAPNLCARRS